MNSPIMEEADVIKLLESTLEDACRTLEITGQIQHAPASVRDYYGQLRAKRIKAQDRFEPFKNS